MLTYLKWSPHSWEWTSSRWPSNVRQQQLPVAAWSCINSPLKLTAAMAWWMLHRALRKSQGNLLGIWTLWPEYMDVLVYVWNSLRSTFSRSFDSATVWSCSEDEEKKKSSYIIFQTEGNIFTSVCLSVPYIILRSMFCTLYYSIAKHIWNSSYTSLHLLDLNVVSPLQEFQK